MSELAGPNVSETNLLLSIIRQQFQQLTRELGIAELLERASRDPEFHKSVREPARDLCRKIGILARGLDHTIAMADFPIAEASPELSSYFRHEVEPHVQSIRALAFARIGKISDYRPDESLAGLFPRIVRNPIDRDLAEAATINRAAVGESNGSNIAKVIGLAIDRLDDEADLEPISFQDQGISENDIQDALDLLEHPSFRPDDWARNRALISPVFAGKPARIPAQVRFRLSEIYRAFIFEIWLSVYTLSRALLEYLLIDRARQLGISAYEEVLPGRTRVRHLADLVQSASEVHPELLGDMDMVKTWGNRVAHPGKGDISFLRSRKEALRCLSAVRTIVTAY